MPSVLDSFDAQRAAQAQQQAEDDANQANEQRFNAIISQLGSFANRAGSQFEQGSEEQLQLLRQLIQDQPQLLASLRDLLGGQVAGSNQDILGMLGDTRGKLQEGFAGRQSSILDFLDKERSGIQEGFAGRESGLMADLARREGEVTSGFQERRESALAKSKGLGRQARSDLGARFREALANASGRLNAAGLGNSTVLGSVSRGISREAAGASNRLNESLRREQIGLDLSTSADLLGAKERFADRSTQASASLSGQALATRERLGSARAGTEAALSGQSLANLGGTDFNLASLMQALQQNETGLLERMGLGEIGTDASLRKALIDLIGQLTQGKISNARTDVGNLVGALERRQDVGPSRGSLGALAGSSGAFAAGPLQFN